MRLARRLSLDPLVASTCRALLRLIQHPSLALLSQRGPFYRTRQQTQKVLSTFDPLITHTQTGTAAVTPTTKRYSNRMTALVSYTWSKSIDTTSGIRTSAQLLNLMCVKMPSATLSELKQQIRQKPDSQDWLPHTGRQSPKLAWATSITSRAHR